MKEFHKTCFLVSATDMLFVLAVNVMMFCRNVVHICTTPLHLFCTVHVPFIQCRIHFANRAYEAKLKHNYRVAMHWLLCSLILNVV